MVFDLDFYKEIHVFDGSQSDVYDAIDLLVRDMGYVLISRAGDLRDVETIGSSDEILSGDSIVFITPEDDSILCIGYDVNSADERKRIVSIVGHLNDFPKNAPIGVNQYDLSDSNNRKYYEKMMQNYQDEYREVVKNFRDFIVVDSTREQLFEYLMKQREQANEKVLTIYHVDSDANETFTINRPEDIEPGMFLIGQLQREDESPQIGVVGYEIEDYAILAFMTDALSVVGQSIDNPIKTSIIRKSFDDVL